MTKTELNKLINESVKRQLNEANDLGSPIENELKKLIKSLNAKEGIDDRMKDKNTGELLAMILIPVFQSALVEMDQKSRKTFRDNIKGKF